LGRSAYRTSELGNRGDALIHVRHWANDILHSVANLVPSGVERSGGFFPGQFARPACQKEHVGFGEGMFTGPGDFLDHNAAGFAVDPAHAVEEKNQETPNGNELERTLGELIVSGCGQVATGTDGFGTHTWPHPNLQALAILAEPGLVVDETREAIALVKKRDNLHVEMGARAKVSTLQQSAAARIDDYCKDFAEWPRSWMGLPEDLVPGEKMVAYFRPFLEHLIEVGLSRKTIRKHVDNLWVLGGELIRDLHETPSLRKVPIETLVFQVIQDGGPILYHNDSAEQEQSFESTCSKFRKFLQGRPSLAPAKRRGK
jgi:hypothetical protein